MFKFFDEKNLSDPKPPEFNVPNQQNCRVAAIKSFDSYHKNDAG